MTAPYSAGVQFPRPDEDRPDPKPVAEPDWSPGSPVSLAHGCLCTSGESFPALGHQLAANCPVHEVHWGVRLPLRAVCYCGGADCTTSCPVYEREGLG